jgi:hypothetical protein
MICTLEIENNNYDVYNQIERFISNLKDVKMFKFDDYKINEKHCIKTLEKINNKELDNFKSVKPEELFKELDF